MNTICLLLTGKQTMGNRGAFPFFFFYLFFYFYLNVFLVLGSEQIVEKMQPVVIDIFANIEQLVPLKIVKFINIPA